MVERTLAWFVRDGHRKVRYRGIERNRIAAGIRAGAVNLQRLGNLGLCWVDNGWDVATG
jgi:IS5 family transposase